MAATALEPGQVVRWRGARWRVLSEEEGGYLRLSGLDHGLRDLEVTPLLELELDHIDPDELPLPAFEPELGDRARWRALHKAYLTTMVGGREHLIGLDWGAIAVEPYQLVPLLRVAKTMRPRLLIADDTGLGKTAEAGIVLRWLAQRHRANRVLIVTRAAPEPGRWQGEMWTKFGFRFDILRDGADFNDRRRRNPTVNVFAQERKLIVSMTLAARQALLDELRQCPVPFDAIIVDEAAHLAIRGKRTKRLAMLGRALSHGSRDGALLLLTATPHDGKTESFLSLLRLLDPLIEVQASSVPVDLASRLIVRRLKPEVTLAGGRRFLEPEIHVVSTLGFASAAEKKIDEPLDRYLEWLAEEQYLHEQARARQKAAGCQFLAGIYRKRFGSSVAALRATLRRRLEITGDLEDEDLKTPYVESDASDPEDEVIDPGAESETPPPPLASKEKELARALLEAAEKVPKGRDSKLEALVKLLNKDIAAKVVIFTEYRDTLRAAARRLVAEKIPFVVFHGGTSDTDREDAMRRFVHDPALRIFLATDAASEGINLQRAASHLIHLDVPWNPNRYAQRNGRIDRYGQDEQPHIWALVAADASKKQGRPEARALEVIIEKLQKIADELGSVGAVLPGFTGSTVRELLQQANEQAVDEMAHLLDSAERGQVTEDLTKLAFRNKTELKEAEEYVARLGITSDFEEQLAGLLKTTFHGWDDEGAIEPAGDGIVKVRIPERLRRTLGAGDTIPSATFVRDIAVLSGEEVGSETIEFLSPAHPLVDATLSLLRDEAHDPSFPHRFDVTVGNPEGLVLSFVVRFVDGEGRTVEERLVAVEVDRDGSVSSDADADLERLGIDAAAGPGVPDPDTTEPWKAPFPSLVDAARVEVARRSEARRDELIMIAKELLVEESQALAAWKGAELERMELMILGPGSLVSLEAAAEFERQQELLESEYHRRLNAIHDRSDVRLAGIELLGGRLIVRGQG